MVFNEEGLKTRVLTMLQPGRKEILMFFYLYAIIELLAIFLDSGIIPTANVSYPVCALHFHLVLC